MDDDDNNYVSPGQQVFHVLLSVFLIAYGAHGWLVNDLFIPGKHRGIHLHGQPALYMLVAILCAVVAMISPVINACDRRDNGQMYKLIAQIGSVLFVTFFIVSLVSNVQRFYK